MRSIGIRVTPKLIYYCIAEYIGNNEVNILTTDKLIIPKALSFPEKLSFIRSTFISIITEYNITNAGIRLTEPKSQNLNILRVNIEGVIQELFANCSVEKYFAGPKVTIASLLSEKVTSISNYFRGDMIFAEIEDWRDIKQEERESIVSAFAALVL